MICLESNSLVEDGNTGNIRVTLTGLTSTSSEALWLVSRIQELVKSRHLPDDSAVAGIPLRPQTNILGEPCNVCKDVFDLRHQDLKDFEEAKNKFTAAFTKVHEQQKQLERSNINLRNQLQEANNNHWAIKHSAKLAEELKVEQDRVVLLQKELALAKFDLVKAEGSKTIEAKPNDPSGRFGLLETD